MWSELASYYGVAIQRVFWGAWGWAVGQGIILTILLVVGGIVFELLRFLRRRSSAAADMKSFGQYLRETGIAALGGAGLVALFLFVVFFVQDAPVQLNDANQKLAHLKSQIASMENAHQKTISQKESIISQLRQRLEQPNIGYSLSISRLIISLDKTNNTNALEIRLMIHNDTQRPLRWRVTKYFFVIAGTEITSMSADSAVIARDTDVMFFANA
jgi:hypothetical protein